MIMSKVWYGCLTNRLEENKMFCEKIEVGTGMTEYYYSDRHPYEVVEVTDQKHIKVRELDHRHIGDGCMDNHWELISNENNAIKALTKRGNYWYWTVVVTKDILDDIDKIETQLFLCHNNIPPMWFMTGDLKNFSPSHGYDSVGSGSAVSPSLDLPL